MTLRYVLHPQPGYPWLLDVAVRYALGPDGLTVETDATNHSTTPAPFGIGFHPYVTVGTERIDDAHLPVPAGEHLVADDRGLPTGKHAVIGGELDFLKPRPLGATRLDTAFTALVRDEDDRAVALLERPDERPLGARVARPRLPLLDGLHGRHAGAGLAPSCGIAIEPMTCPPNALRTGVDLIELEPGGSWRGRGASPSGRGHEVEQAQVVVVGAGFGGLGCARELAKHPHHARVTVVDAHDYHQFLPLLYQVATFQLAGDDVSMDLDDLFRRHDNVTFRLATATARTRPRRR